jgi:hypothetical protein
MIVARANVSNSVASVFMGLNPPGANSRRRVRKWLGRLENVQKTERTGEMETLERFRGSRRVVEDFTRRSLSAIPNAYGRLIYVSSLRESDDRYRHDGLVSLYPDNAVQLALEHCHEELFAQILETGLSQQEEELRTSLAALKGGLGANLALWRNRNRYEELEPRGLPDYLYDLFASNLRLLLELIEADISVRSAA